MLVTDHRSTDGTSEILGEHARDDRVVVIREERGGLRQAEWTTRMSRLAAVEHGADWVIPSDADEFWWPRDGSFAEILGAVPPRFGVVRGLMRHFVLATRRGGAVRAPHGADPPDERPAEPAPRAGEGRRTAPRRT